MGVSRHLLPLRSISDEAPMICLVQDFIDWGPVQVFVCQVVRIMRFHACPGYSLRRVPKALQKRESGLLVLPPHFLDVN